MTAVRMTNLKRALNDQNISPGKKAVLATALESLNAMTANSASLPLIGGIVTSLVDATPSECLRAIDQMLASINAFDPIFFSATQNALASCINSQNSITQVFGQRINLQNNFQVDLFVSGAFELMLALLGAGCVVVDNPVIRVLCFTMAILALLCTMVFSAYVLQDVENIILLERNAINQVKDIVSSPFSTTGKLLSNWFLRGVDPADSIARNIQKGIVMAPSEKSSFDELAKLTTGLVCKWTPVSLKSVYNGLTSFAKQNTSIPNSATTPRPLASFR